MINEPNFEVLSRGQVLKVECLQSDFNEVLACLTNQGWSRMLYAGPKPVGGGHFSATHSNMELTKPIDFHAELERRMEIFKDIKKMSSLEKSSGKWFWCDRDEPHNCNGPFDTYWDMLCDATGPYYVGD